MISAMVAATSVTAAPVPAGEHVPTADQRIVMYNVSWEEFEAILAARGDRSSPRMAYLEGALELMSPSRSHEQIKSYIGRLLEAYALERDIKFSPYGSWLLKQQRKKAGVEPDECYIFGADQNKDQPDLVIEVVWTSGGLDKLEIYQRLGVGEVWFWRKNAIEVYLLTGASYRRAERSACLPELDLALLISLLDQPTVADAILALRAKLRAP